MTTVDESERGPEEPSNNHVLLGAALMLIGFAFLADQIRWFDVEISYWPLIPLFIGAAKMLAPGYRAGRRRSRRGGFWLVAVGVWGLICEFELFGLDYSTAWPLLIVAAGLNIVLRSLDVPAQRVKES